MANRFPIIVDSSGVPALKELASGDNLDLTGSGIVNAGAVNATTVNAATVALSNMTVGGSQGTDGQVLTSTGSGVQWEDAASGGGGGAWTRISTSTISSTTAELEISLSGYTEYVLRFFGVNLGTTARWVNIYMTTSGGNYSESLMYGRWGYASNIASGSGSSSQSASYIHGYAGGMVHSTNGNIFGNLNITNVVGQPALYGLMGTSDEHASNGAGWQTVMARYVSPGSSDTIAKLKFKPDSGFLEAGTYVLYGLSTS